MTMRPVHLVVRAAVFTLAAAACIPSGPSVAEPQGRQPFSFDTTPGRLPKTVVPSAYRLHLTPDPATRRFTGDEHIDVTVKQPVGAIVLDAVNLKFDRVTLLPSSAAAARVTVDPKAGTATFDFGRTIRPGTYTLAIRYSGPITLAPSGLYYTDYDQAGGRKRMIVTQFESIDARRMFPSWDEPAFKATYSLEATLPAMWTVLSNTPVIHAVAAGKSPSGVPLKTTTFATTPKMSSYLVVLVAGELRGVSAEAAAGTTIGVWSQAGKERLGNAALADASKILPYYNDYFGVKYPLPKLDLIAVPGNFAAGAMENWGAITFIDSALLYDPIHSTPQTRETVFGVIAHEMAHQWSGDLVTMAWWNDIWLNEGFASWMAAKAADHFHPGWNVRLNERSSKEFAMSLDARAASSHPIQRDVTTEDDIARTFDQIAYNKGEALLNMIESYLGEEAFRDGMRAYMARHAYSNTTSADFWASLGAASGKPVAQIAADFTSRPGVPLVLVNASCSGGKTAVTLTQDRFTVNDPQAAKITWHIPVRLAAFGAGAPQTQTLIVPPEGTRTVFDGCDLPISANFGDSGYYRVQYGAESLRALEHSYAALPASERVTLLDDQYALAQAGRSQLSSFLALVQNLGGEKEYAVWRGVLSAFAQIDTLERGTPQQAVFRAYARSVLDPQLARLGWESRAGEPADDAIFRNELISALGRYDDAGVIAESRARFAAFVRDPGSLPPDISPGVLNTVGAHADQAAWNELRAFAKAAQGTELKLRYYYALANARDPKLIDQTVKIATTDELPNGRVNRFLELAAQNSGDPSRVFDDVVADLPAIVAKLEPNQAGGLLPGIAAASGDQRIVEKLMALPAAAANPSTRYAASLAAGRAADAAMLRASLTPQMSSWIAANPSFVNQ